MSRSDPVVATVGDSGSGRPGGSRVADTPSSRLPCEAVFVRSEEVGVGSRMLGSGGSEIRDEFDEEDAGSRDRAIPVAERGAKSTDLMELRPGDFTSPDNASDHG